MDSVNFSEWLLRQITNKGWSQADLARKSGLSKQAISNYMAAKINKPDEDALKSIAQALRLSPETVFRAAGLLPPKPEINPTIEEVNAKIALLPEHQQRQILEYVEFLLERGDRDATSPAPDSRSPLAPSER